MSLKPFKLSTLAAPEIETTITWLLKPCFWKRRSGLPKRRGSRDCCTQWLI